MSINVYWSCLEKEWMRSESPSPIFPPFAKRYSNLDSGVVQCPALQDEHKNLFGIRSLYDYEFEIDLENNTVSTCDYDKEFYDWHVLVRDFSERFFTFSQEYIFFTDEKSLKMSAGLHPHLENNNITERCTIIPGMFDIGKWYRPIEFAFFLKPQFSTFKIEQNEIFQYIKFHTSKKINFIQYKESDMLKLYLNDVMNIRKNKKNVQSLVSYYKNFRLKKHILKNIKENIL